MSWRLPLRDAVQRRVFLFEVRDQRLMAERLSRDALAQFSGAIMLPRPMHLFVEPTLEPTEATAAEVSIEIAQVLPRLLHELSGVQVAERVRREVTEATHTPVNVLQATLRIIRRRQIEHLAKLLVPCIGHIVRVQGARHP